MGKKNLESGAVSVFCESISVMLAAGIQTEEAVGLLSENTGDEVFRTTCEKVYKGLIERKTMADSMDETGSFPSFAIDMTRTGEASGRLEATMKSLSRYYSEEDRLISKLHSAVMYPVALFALMTVILLFTILVILPIFLNTYQELAGGLGTGTYAFVNASMIVGWVALAISAVCTIATFIVAAMTRSQNNLQALESLLEKLPMTRNAANQMALSRFTTILTSYVAIGMPTDKAVAQAGETVHLKKLRAKIDAAVVEMQDLDHPKSLSNALSDNGVYGAVYTRMMMVGDTSGNLETVLNQMGTTFFEDALIQMDESLDRIEPALAAFLTVTVGATLIAVMLPLIGILGSIG